jgi:N-acyl-D-aspartate/D-glutamate deacylase
VGDAADEATIKRMEALLRASLEAGAIGFSSSWGLTHIDGEGQPVPSRHADRAELMALCRAVRDYEGTSLEFIPTNGPFPAWVAELTADMSVEAQRPLNWNILHVYADSLQDGLAKLAGGDVARAKGGKVIGLTMPISTSPRFSLLTGAVLESLPGWGELFALPLNPRIEVFRDRDARRRLNERAQDSGTFININWSDHVIWDTYAPENEQYRGRTLGEIAQNSGGDAWSTLCEIAARDDLRTSFGPKPRVTTKEDWAARVSVWRDARAVIGASDAGAHLDMVAGFSFCTGMLAAVRDQQLMSIEEAVHLLTDVQAQLYGIRERGQLQEGWHADLVVFDPVTVGSDEAAMRFDLPGGGGRLYAASRGIDHVIVNGSCLVRDGALTSSRSGTVLRSGRDTSTPSMS